MTRILLIEDNEMNRDMLSRRLVKRGFQVILATDGREGIRLASSETPDVILMDMSLPEIDGWEVTRTLKASPETAAIPIIALTAHAMEEDRVAAAEAGCVAFLAKPAEPGCVAAEVGRVLALAR